MQIDEALRLAQQGIARKRKLEAMIKALEFDRTSFAGHARDMEERLKKENLDVQKLENMSLKKVIYTIFSILVERTEKEKEEALEVKLKYDAAKKDVEDIDQKIKVCKDELAQYADIQQRYDSLYAKKQEMLMQTSPDVAQTIMEKTTSANASVNMVKEIDEAICAGEQALSVLDDAVYFLDKAELWSFLQGRKGLVTGLIKDQYLDELQESMWNTSRHVRELNKELADIGIVSDLHLEPVYFDNDGWLSWRSEERRGMDSAESRLDHTKKRVSHVLGDLEMLSDKMQKQAQAAKAELDVLVLGGDTDTP